MHQTETELPNFVEKVIAGIQKQKLNIYFKLEETLTGSENAKNLFNGKNDPFTVSFKK